MNKRNPVSRFLSMLLVLVMVFGMVPFQAFAADNAVAVDATIIFTDLHTGNGDYKESTVKGIMTAFKNSGLPISSVTSGGDAFSSNESSYTAYTDTITGYIRNALGSNVPVNYVWSDHDRGAQNNSSSKTALDKTSRLVYGAGNDGVYGTADDGNYYVYALSMADLCTYDRYSTGFNYTASSNNRAKNGYTSTVPQAIENFLNDAAKLNKDRPLFIVSHQPLFDNRNDNGWAEDWCNAINEVGTEMDVAFFYGHNHKYDSGSDYYYAKGSTMPVATRKFTDGKDWNYNYQVGSGWQYDKDLASVNKVLNFTHMCAGYLSPATESGTTRKGTAMAITIYPDSIRYTTYNSSGIYNGSYAVDKTVTREFAVTEPEEPVVPSEPAQTEPTVPSEPEATEPTEPEATEPPVSDELDSEKVYVLVDAPVDGGKYLIVNQTLTNGDLSKDWDTDDDGMAVIRNGESISYSYAVPKAGTITDANGNVYTKGYIEYNDENAVWTVHASGKAWTIENDGYYLNKGSDNGVSATKNSLTWNYTANGDDSRLYNGSDYLYFTYYGGDRNSWRWRTGTESGTSSTRDLFFYQEVVLTAPDTEPDPTPDVRPDSNDVVVGDGSYIYNKVDAASSLQEGYYRLHNNYTSKYLTNTKTSNANRLNLDANGQNHIWYIKPVSGGYTIQYGGPTGQYLNFAHQSASMSSSAQTVKILNTNGYWGIGAISGNPAAYLAREGSSNTSGSAHGYASNDYKYPGDVGMDWNLYQRVENRKTYSVSASDIHHYLGQNDDQVRLTYSLLVNGAAGTLPAGGSWNFSTHQDTDGIVKNISSSGVITFNKVEGSCYIKAAYTWSEGTAYMYVKVTAERDPNACEHVYTAVTVDATCTADGSITYTCQCGDSYVEIIKATGHDYTSKVTVPTCTEAGYTTYTCHCGDTYVTDKTAALGHTHQSKVTKPTCTEEGYTTYTCACGDTYVADQVAALGHSYKSVTVEAACTADGSITYTCQCGDSYVEIIKATGHDYTSKVTVPTCTEGGYTTYTCHCGDSYVADKTAALGHTHQSKVTKPTCTEEGYTTYTCACGDTYVADQVAALGHSYKSVTVEATCTKDGSITYTCACGDSYVEVIKAHGHDYTSVVTAPTCTEAGHTTHTCTTCGHSYTSDEVAALGHSYTDLILAPTCIADGYTVHTCTTCGHRYTSNRVAALGHSYESFTVAPTCTADGSVTYTCHCGEFYVEVIEALGHDYKTVTVEATCTVDGSVAYTCHCGDSYAEVIKATGHDHKAKVTKPTCTEAGFTTYTCHCGDSYTADEVAALGHNYESVTVKPACTEDGFVICTCACGDSYTEVIKAKGHEHKAAVTAPTCTEAGYTTYTCACGDTYTADEVEALGHDYKSVVTAPTCTKGGYTTYTCGVCDHSYTADKVAATGHDHKAVVTAPTCTEEGYTTYTCHCGDTYTADEVAALGHKHQAVTVEATCIVDGSVTYTCACGDSYVEVIKAPGHEYSSVVTAPTCTEGGFTTYTCAACGQSYIAGKVAALGHTYESVTVDATCTADGSVTYTCHCGDTYTEVIKATGHDHKATVTAPTCTAEGYTTYTCACGDTYTADKAAALGHTYESVTVAATCTKDGSVTYTCACGDTYTEVIKATGHDHKATVTAPTCTAEGYTTYTCACGDTYTADKAAALGHSHKSVTVAATCTKDGSVTYTCACGDTYTEVIKAAGHDHKATVTAPTCTASGCTTYTCHCGDSYTTDKVAALGHSYVCVDSGDSLVYTCSKCGASYTEVIAREWVKAGSAYVLDTDGIDVGTQHKYVVVGATQDYAMTLDGDRITPTKVTIEGNVLTWDKADKNAFYFYSNTSREKNTYLLTQDSSKGIYHVSSEIKYGHDSKGYWYFGSGSNGTYQLYDYDSSANWYMNYGYAWNNESVSRFAASSSARSVRLFKYTDVYARLAGSLHQIYTTDNGATADSVLKKLNIETSANGSTVSGTIAVTASMVSWHNGFNGNVPGVYTATVTYQGVQLGTIQVTVSDNHTYVTRVIAPTCTTEGYTLHTCTDCGYSKTDAVTQALGHDYGCVESDGYLHYTCTRCGDAYSQKAVTYVQASGISAGNSYVIAMYTGGKYYALSHAGNTLSAVEISVSSGEITSEISQDLLWSYKDNKLGYEQNGTTYRLYGRKVTTKTGTLSISTSQSSSVSFSSNRLKINNQYLRYINGNISLNASAANTYLFTAK